MWNEMDVRAELMAWVSKNGPLDDKDIQLPGLLFGEPLGIAETLGRDCKTIEALYQFINCVDIQV